LGTAGASACTSKPRAADVAEAYLDQSEQPHTLSSPAATWQHERLTTQIIELPQARRRFGRRFDLPTTILRLAYIILRTPSMPGHFLSLAEP
jgi:hypothetical protein